MKSEVFNIDCMEGMKQYPDKYFNLAIVDPPYGIGGDKGIQKNKGNFGFKSHKATDWDNAIPDKTYFKELLRCSKNQIVWGGNYFTEYLQPKMCWLSWDKMQTNFSFSDFELAWTSFDTKCKKFELIRGFDEKGVHYSTTNGRIHPTQKPVALYRQLLTNYAKQGDKILDTHLGSGSSRIAAHQLGFDFTGYEIDKDYFDASEKRFKLVTSQKQIDFK